MTGTIKPSVPALAVVRNALAAPPVEAERCVCPVCFTPLGATVREHGHGAGPWTDDQEILLRRMRHAGLPHKVIAYVFGISPSAVRSRLYGQDRKKKTAPAEMADAAD
jgi:hypothetical protein